MTQDHAADIAKLKAAKEAAELKQIQMQKEMKDEAERLRVQFIFKVITWVPHNSTDMLKVHSAT